MSKKIKYISELMSQDQNDRDKAVDEYLQQFTNKRGEVSDTIKSIAERYRIPTQEMNRTLTPTKLRTGEFESKTTQENRKKRREIIDELRRSKSNFEQPKSSFTESQEEALDFFQKEIPPTTPTKSNIVTEMPSNSPFWDINAHRLSKADKKTFQQIMGPSGNIIADKYSTNVLSPYTSPEKVNESQEDVQMIDLGLDFTEDLNEGKRGGKRHKHKSRKIRKSRGKRVIKGKNKTKRRTISSRRK